LKEVQQSIDARKEMEATSKKRKLLLELVEPSELENNVAGSTNNTLAQVGIPNKEDENVSSSSAEASQRASEAEQFADAPDVPLRPVEKKHVSCYHSNKNKNIIGLFFILL